MTRPGIKTVSSGEPATEKPEEPISAASISTWLPDNGCVNRMTGGGVSEILGFLIFLLLKTGMASSRASTTNPCLSASLQNRKIRHRAWSVEVPFSAHRVITTLLRGSAGSWNAIPSRSAPSSSMRHAAELNSTRWPLSSSSEILTVAAICLAV